MNSTAVTTVRGELHPASTQARVPSARALLALGLVVAVGAALLASRGSDAYAGDPELAMLLRLMGVIKLAMAAGAAALVAWRLGSPVERVSRWVAVAASWCLAAGAVLVTTLAHMMVATLLFHTGLLALIVLALLEGRRAWR